jgi:hypothetical protein
MLYLLIALAVIGVVGIGFVVSQAYNVIFRGYAPLVPTGPKVIMRILEVLDLRGDFAGKKVYELGCGRANFLQEFHKMYPKPVLYGIENSFLMAMAAKIQILWKKLPITIVHSDIFHYDIGDADLIYCYLNEQMMKDLAKKFKFECKRRVKIVSHQFPIPGFEVTKVIELFDVKVKKGYENKVYFYDI